MCARHKRNEAWMVDAKGVGLDVLPKVRKHIRERPAFVRRRPMQRRTHLFGRGRAANRLIWKGFVVPSAQT